MNVGLNLCIFREVWNYWYEIFIAYTIRFSTYISFTIYWQVIIFSFKNLFIWLNFKYIDAILLVVLIFIFVSLCMHLLLFYIRNIEFISFVSSFLSWSILPDVFICAKFFKVVITDLLNYLYFLLLIYFLFY